MSVDITPSVTESRITSFSATLLTKIVEMRPAEHRRGYVHDMYFANAVGACRESWRALTRATVTSAELYRVAGVFVEMVKRDLKNASQKGQEAGFRWVLKATEEYL